jgi:hypothetical protein
MGEFQRALVGVPGLGVAAAAVEQVGAGGVVVAVVAEVELVQDGQARVGPVEFGHGDGPVHFHDRGAGLPGEGVVERGDLVPVAGLVQVQVGDGCLQGVGPGGAAGDRLLKELPAVSDLLPVP